MHPLRQLFWECTLRCNMSCLHCGSDCKVSSVLPDMPAEDFLKVIDEQITPHVNPHLLMVIFSGGEPLMRGDIEEVGRALYEREYPWGMVSNGLLLTQERFERLVQAGLRSMTISCDGLEPDHTWLRNNPQAFQGATNAIRLLAGSNLTWDVVTCVNKRTIHQLDAIRKQLWELGCRRWRLFTIVPMGRAIHHPELFLDEQEFETMMRFIDDERKQNRQVSFSCESFLGDWEGKVRNYLYQCAAGISVASILVDGHISACTSVRGKYYQGNIYHDNFWDVWENRFEQYRNRDWMRTTKPCNDCTFFRYCEGGGMHLRAENGDLLCCRTVNYNVNGKI